MHSSPQIFCEVVLSEVREIMKRVEKVVFLVRKDPEKRGKIRKSHHIFWPRKWKFFPEKRHLGPREIFPSPPNSAQVSATAAVYCYNNVTLCVLA